MSDFLTKRGSHTGYIGRLGGRTAKVDLSGGAATEANPLILYDLESNLSDGMSWSPNVWKIRLLLNYKKIPHRTVWLAFPEVEPTLKALNFKPSSVSKSSGKEFYTVPAIVDPSEDGEPNLVVDSPIIARYLESKYPAKPLFPEGSHAFQSLFVKWSRLNLLGPLIQLLIAPQVPIFHGPSREYYVRTRTELFGDLNQMGRGEHRRKELAKLKDSLATLDSFLQANLEGDFWMGKTISYSDCILAAYLIWARRIPCGDRDPEHETLWDVIRTWNNGRWERIMAAFEPYMAQK